MHIILPSSQYLLSLSSPGLVNLFSDGMYLDALCDCRSLGKLLRQSVSVTISLPLQ